MDREFDISFVVENGVLRPDQQLSLPDGARGVAHIRTSDAESAERFAWLKAQEQHFGTIWDNDDDAAYDQL